MDITKPLRASVRPKVPSLAQRFSRDLIAEFQKSDRLVAEVTDVGLLIGGIWHPDLDAAYEIVHSIYAGDVLWGQAQIHYVHERLREEPLLLVTVRTPEPYLGNVIGDLSSRRSIITSHQEIDDSIHQVTAEAPLAELRGYIESLSVLSQGSASATAEFHSYQIAPRTDPPDDEPMSAALRA